MLKEAIKMTAFILPTITSLQCILSHHRVAANHLFAPIKLMQAENLKPL